MFINTSHIINDYASAEDIVKFLDEQYESLEGLKVSLFIYKEDIGFILKLLEMLNSCGCEVTVIGSSKDHENNRMLFELSDVIVCALMDHEINQTYYPKLNSRLIDITCASCNVEFIKNAMNDSSFKYCARIIYNNNED